MVAALWFSETLGSNYNAGKLPLVAGVPVDPITTPSGLLSKGVVTACDSFTATTITFSEATWAEFTTAPVAGDSACFETSGTGAGQKIVTLTDVTGRVCTWTGGATDGIAGVANIDTDGTFVRFGVGGARLNLSVDVLALGGCLSHFGASYLAHADNHTCWLDGAFTVALPGRSWFMPLWKGLPNATVTATSGTALTTYGDITSASAWSTTNVQWIGSSSMGITSLYNLYCDAVSSSIKTMHLSTAYAAFQYMAANGSDYPGADNFAMIDQNKDLRLYRYSSPNATNAPACSHIAFDYNTGSNYGVLIYKTSGNIGSIKDSIVIRDKNDATIDAVDESEDYGVETDIHHNCIFDQSQKQLLYRGTSYRGPAESGTANIRSGSGDYYGDPKISENVDGYYVIAADSPCIGSASDGSNKGPCNITIAGDAAITVTKGQASSDSWTMTDDAGTSSIINPYISTGTLPAGLSLSSHGYSPLTATISGTCTANNGTYNVTLRGSNGVTATYLDITITVEGGSTDPLKADAGPDQYAIVGDLVRLDGSGSTGATSYLWEQVGGESVTLSSSTDSTPTFTAISSSEATFKLTGSNGVDTDSDEVLIVINGGVSSMSYCTNDPSYSGIVASDSITQSGYIDSAITIYREVNMLIVRNAGKHVMELTIDDSSLYGIPLRPKECLTMRVYGTHCPRMYVHMADGESAIVIQRC